MDNISFEMKSQNEAEPTDVNGDRLRLIYDQETRTVIRNMRERKRIKKDLHSGNCGRPRN